MTQGLSFEQVARYPRPGMSGPQRVTFTPDGANVAYLFSPGADLVQQLWLYNVRTGEKRSIAGGESAPTQPLTLEEELRHARLRVREFGVTSYHFAAKATELTVCVPMGGKVFIKRGDSPLIELDGAAGAQDPRLSPDGQHLAFVRDNELWVIGLDGGAARQLTHGAGEGVTNGVAEYVAQEEMGRLEGYWWSGDSRRIAYIQADSRHIQAYAIVHQGKEQLEIEEHRYPFPGQTNALVRLGVVSADGGDTTWMDTGTDSDIYLARVAWRQDGSLTAQIESRDQRTLRLIAFDPQTGKDALLIEEKSATWINLNSDTRFLSSGEIIWISERSGFAHLYLYDAAGQHVRPLTSGEWMVTCVVGVDEDRRLIYFKGTRDGVLERPLYVVSLDGGEPRRLTAETGWHDVVMGPDCNHYVDTWSSVQHPPQVVLYTIEGAQEAVLYANDSVTPQSIALNPPELSAFPSRDGITLYAAVYSPALETGKRYPIIVSVYGGPHAQRVANIWDSTVDMRAQYLAQAGFIVLKVDNRGSANRGIAFESAIANDMGNLEVRDQEDGVRWLAQRPYVDGQRVGIYGWSYGGYMTCMALLRAPETFKVGVAGAPVTDWAGYDTHYTERYMQTPQTNADGYRESSVLSHVENLRGKLMIIHGMVDENVHFRHTARLIQALNTAQIPYDLLIYPEERHMPRDAKGLEYMERRIARYFEANL